YRPPDERHGSRDFRTAAARRGRSEPGLQNHNGPGSDAELRGRGPEKIDRRLPDDCRVRHFEKARHDRTLYDVGNPEARAQALKKENERRRAAGEPVRLPQENYYGWLVNDKLPELEALFAS